MRPQDKCCVNWWRSQRGLDYKRITKVVTKRGVSQGIMVDEKGFEPSASSLRTMSILS